MVLAERSEPAWSDASVHEAKLATNAVAVASWTYVHFEPAPIRWTV